MKKPALSLLVCLLLASSFGCASREGLAIILNELGSKNQLPVDESKLVYIKQQRCFKYNDELLLHDNAEKIRTREEALQLLDVRKTQPKQSFGERVAEALTIVYVVPVGLSLYIVNEIALLPASPYTNYKAHQPKKDAFQEYGKGRRLLENGKFGDARVHFLKALRLTEIAHASDAYYQIAETYAGEGNDALARDYYRRFLNHSLALYPVYFADYDKSFTNDLNILDQEFTRAEQKLASGEIEL